MLRRSIRGENLKAETITFCHITYLGTRNRFDQQFTVKKIFGIISVLHGRSEYPELEFGYWLNKRNL